MSISLQDIHEAISDLRRKGRKLEDLEAFLVNTDDFRELLGSLAENQHIVQIGNGLKEGYVRKEGDKATFDILQDTTIFGIKIVDSPHAQRGSIFKIFKDDDKQFIEPPATVGVSGIFLPEKMVDDTFLKSLEEEEVDDPTTTHEVKQDRHSFIRKIQLGQ